MKTELICIACPQGCTLTVEHDQEAIASITGNGCKRGIPYAEAEIFHPERLVTTTVRIDHAAIPLLPVKTSQAIPKGKVPAVLRELAGLCVQAPVAVGDILVRDIGGTGADVVATRSLPMANHSG
jgi:CxxC motif-containing protein